MKLVTVKMSDIYVNGLDKLVEIGMYPSRSEAIRVAISPHFYDEKDFNA